MLEPKKKRNTAGPRCEKEYLKAIRAAVRYVAAVQACIQCDPAFRHVRPGRFRRDPYVRTISVAGILAAMNISPVAGTLSGDWRQAFHYFFQDNVSFEFTVREQHRGRNCPWLAPRRRPAAAATGSRTRA